MRSFHFPGRAVESNTPLGDAIVTASQNAGDAPVKALT
jgi:hypothetical protein